MYSVASGMSKPEVPGDPTDTPSLLHETHRVHAETRKMQICYICHIHTVYTRGWSQGIEPLQGLDKEYRECYNFIR